MKQQFGIAVAVFAIVAGGSIALAEDGDAPAEEPTEVEVPLDEVDEQTDDVDDEADDLDEADDEADDEAVDADGAEENHGAVVSEAAHECPTGPGGVHGQCVSAVARDHDGDGVPDHGPGSPGFGGDEEDDDADEADDDADDDADEDVEQPTGAPGNGRGNGGGNGRGHG